MDYRIENCGGHVEVRDCSGKFMFSADTLSEAYHELQEIDAHGRNGE